MAKQDRGAAQACGAIIHDEYVPDGGDHRFCRSMGYGRRSECRLRNCAPSSTGSTHAVSELTPSSRIKRCHALSIDDDRRTFYPELWNEKGIPAAQVDQVWFAGVHSNVGGGYVKHGMSLVALDWMMAEAERCGPRCIQADREYVHTNQDVHD